MTAVGDSSAHDRAEWLRTSVGASTPDSIILRGRDLAAEVMGVMSFGELAFFLVAGRVPSEGEAHLFNAVLVSLADHGLTPSALAARLTYTGAPESLQGAIAAGLLGGGSVFLGPVEDTARFLHGITTALPAAPMGEEDMERAAEAAVRAAIESGQRVPGLGHPIHRDADPRTPRLYQLAEEAGLVGPHLRLLRMVSDAHRRITNRGLPINGAGAAGAALADLGFPPTVVRGFALLARTAGLVAHLAEESERPIGMPLWKEIDRRAVYEGPDDPHG